MIPDSVIHEIQDRLNIVDVISQFVPLRRAGRSFKGLCVFHEEKTPSFVVSPDKQIFHCFGCGVSGNVISFLMKYKQMEFREAVRELADRAGIPIPDDERSDTDAKDRKDVLDVLKAAVQFFSERFEREEQESAVRKYIAKRGLLRETIVQFHLGYSPPGWDGLAQWAARRFSASILEKAGLVVPKTGGGTYDRFRNRLMFPIYDVKGNAVGFGARALDETFPKYLNSPETPVYRKGKNLYGLYWALDAVRSEDRVILVEGYIDAIRCFQSGIRNVAASSGTSLTPDQIRLIKRYTRKVTVLFDGDKAGEMATLRGLDLLVQEDCEVSVATLPAGLDPDAYIDRHGAENFKESVLGQSQSLFDYKMGLLRRRVGTRTVEDKVRIAMEMLETIRKIPNAVLQSSLVRKLAGEMQIAENALLIELERKGSGGTGLWAGRQAAAQVPPAGEEASLWERTLIGLFLTFPDCAEEAKAAITLADFKSTRARSVAKLILDEHPAAALKPAQFLNHLRDDPDSSTLVTRAIHEVEQITDPRRALRECLHWIERVHRKEAKRRLSEEIRAAEMNGDIPRRDELVKQFHTVHQKERITRSE